MAITQWLKRLFGKEDVEGIKKTLPHSRVSVETVKALVPKTLEEKISLH